MPGDPDRETRMRQRYPSSNRGRASGFADARLSKRGYCTTHNESFNQYMRAGSPPSPR